MTAYFPLFPEDYSDTLAMLRPRRSSLQDRPVGVRDVRGILAHQYWPNPADLERFDAKATDRHLARSWVRQNSRR